MPIQGNARKRINEKEAFVLWYELGTLEKTQTHMKIAVVGAGAMGSLFGAMLAEAGNEVCFLLRDADVLAPVGEVVNRGLEHLLG